MRLFMFSVDASVCALSRYLGQFLVFLSRACGMISGLYHCINGSVYFCDMQKNKIRVSEDKCHIVVKSV